MAKLPRLQPIRYPAQEGQDVVFGLRLTIPNYAVKGDAHGWLFEVGKISDDSLKTHLVGSFVGCADNLSVLVLIRCCRVTRGSAWTQKNWELRVEVER